MKFSINKGIDRQVEFKGLKAQYLVIFAAGLLAIFILFIIMYVIGIPQNVCIGFALLASTTLV